MTVIELKERYVYAATRRLPNKARHDIAKELDTLIDDMLLERCGDNIPEEKDLRVVFAEIGQPSEIHRKYSPRADKSLIAPPYYEPYVFVMKIVFACVLVGLTLAHIISLLASPSNPWGVVLTWIPTLAVVLCVTFTFITLLFAFFSCKGIDLKDFDDETNNLQPVPKTNLRISKGESIVNIVMCIAFSIIFIALPNIIVVAVSKNEVVTPLFNAQVLRSSWIWIIIFSGLGIFKECVAMLDGKYTKRLLYVTIFTNIGTLICAIIIFSNENLINLNVVFNNQFITAVTSNFNIFFMIIIIFALILETCETLYKYYKTQSIN